MSKIIKMCSLILVGIFSIAEAHAATGKAFIQPIVTDFPQIQLNVNILDSNGHPVYGLKPEQFSLMEDLKSVEITGFEAKKAEEMKHNKVDIVFVFDDTGSMASEIKGLKEKTIEFADIIQSSGFDYELGLITYKDTINKPFRRTKNAEAFKGWVSSLHATGGADEPENALDAIEAAYRQPFRDEARVIFILITDATFHARDSISPLSMQEIITDLAERNIQLHVVGPNIDQYKAMTSELGGTFYDKDSGQFKRIITQIAGGSSGNYTLTFASRRPSYDFTWRSVELTLAGHPLADNVTQYQAPSWVTASSRRYSLKGNESPYSPHFVVDGDKNTCWAEGVAGSGVKEWIALNFNEPVMADHFTIHPPKNGVHMPSSISVTLNGDDKRHYEVDPGSGLISGTFEKDLPITQFKVTIEKASGDTVGFSKIELSGGKPRALVGPLKKAQEIRFSRKISRDMNKKGEELYHKKKYDEAIYYYKESIEKDPTYAQAFSNLGLAYQRADDYPNAIWANRKAIALARGKHKKTVSASSYYNIARIFEAQNKYEEALQNFIWAKSFKSHSAYDSGIARMNEKLGM
ncbi:tetratricopeptide repeat protein [Desulfoluna spongiiphila]|uniref:tetratricopeptide repeat protein n=1 Tax=Desulfoluna spongiiphila TaxID=419481 RepID=UPI0012571B50|nr:tetratricopeptide repeat protein [Desulfoluna spongiiphila]VVS91915.1 von willebrand factor type a [Desulfoluna spongiiphila]